MFYVVVICVVL